MVRSGGAVGGGAAAAAAAALVMMSPAAPADVHAAIVPLGSTEESGNPPDSASVSAAVVPLSLAYRDSSSSLVNITTTAAMRDTDGNPITDCLEPHISRFNGTWYAYGFTARDEPHQFAGTCYSSTDLRTWQLRASYPTNASVDGTNPQTAVALWNVLYNAKNNEYVGYGGEYGAQLHVYTSATPEGPFAYRAPFSQVHGGMGDILMFPDEGTGKAYLVYNSYHGDGGGGVSARFSHVYELNNNYYSVVPSTLSNTTAVMEGFWMFRRSATYYLVGSHLSGYGVNDNFYLTAPHPLGPWTPRGLIAPAGTDTFHSQTFQGLVVTGPKGSAFVYIGQRWGAPRPPFPNATSVWLPLGFGESGEIETMRWFDRWVLDTQGAVLPPALVRSR